jgi:hypothetical protein
MTGVVVRGNATAEELAGVLAALSARRPGHDSSTPDGSAERNGYAAWRRGRLRALAQPGAQRGE